jgi:HSP20 family protein
VRHYGKFSNSFTLPATVDPDKIEASLEDGVLTVALPKSTVAKPRSIESQAGKGGVFSKLLGTDKKREEKNAGSGTNATDH